MKNQALISSKEKSKNLKCRLLHFFFGALRVNRITIRTAKTSFNFGQSESNRVKIMEKHAGVSG